jgi:hypothetical protein
MTSAFDFMKSRLSKSFERERHLERPVEKLSRVLWPWPESKLIMFVSLLAFLDFASTYAFLRLSGNQRVFEAGPLASWALQTGGFLKLFLIDGASMGLLILLALSTRLLYNRLGFPGFGRAAFVIVLAPYAIIIIAVVMNNILLTFI